MYLEQGAAKVRATTCFAMLAAIPFAIFLLVFKLYFKKEPYIYFNFYSKCSMDNFIISAGANLE